MEYNFDAEHLAKHFDTIKIGAGPNQRRTKNDLALLFALIKLLMTSSQFCVELKSLTFGIYVAIMLICQLLLQPVISGDLQRNIVLL